MSAPLLPEAILSAVPPLTETRDVWFCLDYDGTLAPIAATPEAATPLPGTERVLDDLARSSGVHIAIVTGRSISSVRRLLDVPHAYYIGTHGLELRAPGSATEESPLAAQVRPALQEIARRVRAKADAWPEILVEAKGAAVACHYRNAEPEIAVTARNFLIEQCKEFVARDVPITTLQGQSVLEVLPAGVNKGDAIRGLLDRGPEDALPFFVGDDETDESAFVRLPDNAITIRVGPETAQTAARYKLGSCDELQRFLRLIAACRCVRRWG
jgi:trehalose 6-phosphate phosphatase